MTHLPKKSGEKEEENNSFIDGLFRFVSTLFQLERLLHLCSISLLHIVQICYERQIERFVNTLRSLTLTQHSIFQLCEQQLQAYMFQIALWINVEIFHFCMGCR